MSIMLTGAVMFSPIIQGYIVLVCTQMEHYLLHQCFSLSTISFSDGAYVHWKLRQPLHSSQESSDNLSILLRKALNFLLKNDVLLSVRANNSMSHQWQTCSLPVRQQFSIHLLVSDAPQTMSSIFLFCSSNDFLDHHLEGSIIQLFIPATWDYAYSVHNDSIHCKNYLQVFHTEKTLSYLYDLLWSFCSLSFIIDLIQASNWSIDIASIWEEAQRSCLTYSGNPIMNAHTKSCSC